MKPFDINAIQKNIYPHTFNDSTILNHKDNQITMSKILISIKAMYIYLYTKSCDQLCNLCHVKKKEEAKKIIAAIHRSKANKIKNEALTESQFNLLITKYMHIPQFSQCIREIENSEIEFMTYYRPSLLTLQISEEQYSKITMRIAAKQLFTVQKEASNYKGKIKSDTPEFEIRHN